MSDDTTTYRKEWMPDQSIKVDEVAIKRPYCCPVCNGAGTVSRPPHVAGDQIAWSGSGAEFYTCHACNGAGIVWG